MTYQVPLDMVGFPSWVPAPTTLEISDDLLTWATATLGERRRAPRDSGFVRRAQRRLGTLRDAFSTTCGCHLTHSRNYLTMADPSDRSTISYLLGGVSAKLAASLLVGVPYLVHFDAVLSENGQSLRGRRPDFVGVGKPPLNARVTVEAKGTVGSANGALDGAVDQAKGSGPRPRSRRLAWGQQAHFTNPGWSERVWSASMVDPPSEQFEFPQPEDVLVGYFTPLVRDVLGDGFSEVGGEESLWRVADFVDVGIQIAIRSDVAIAAGNADGATLVQLCGLLGGDGQSANDVVEDEVGLVNEVGTTQERSPAGYWGSPLWPGTADQLGGFVGPDGVAIRVSPRARRWTDQYIDLP